MDPAKKSERYNTDAKRSKTPERTTAEFPEKEDSAAVFCYGAQGHDIRLCGQLLSDFLRKKGERYL